MRTNSAVKNFIFRCVVCRRLRKRIGEQSIADLLGCRLTETAPFIHCGVDIFGPSIVKQKRSKVRRSDDNDFCGMVDRRKAFSLIYSRDHCQRSSPSLISDTPRAGCEPA